MKLTWLGHACFLLEQNGYRLIVDPYTGVEGYPELRVKAHQVVCSHQHHDHNAVEQITPLPAQENPFTIRVVKTFHDDQGGALRGENTIHVISAAQTNQGENAEFRIQQLAFTEHDAFFGLQQDVYKRQASSFVTGTVAVVDGGFNAFAM